MQSSPSRIERAWALAWAEAADHSQTPSSGVAPPAQKLVSWSVGTSDEPLP